MTDQENKERMKAAIAWHLANNFIPPQPPELLDFCYEAIVACNDNEPTKAIYLPGGVMVTAEELVNDLRLEDMVEAEA